MKFEILQFFIVGIIMVFLTLLLVIFAGSGTIIHSNDGKRFKVDLG